MPKPVGRRVRESLVRRVRRFGAIGALDARVGGDVSVGDRGAGMDKREGP